MTREQAAKILPWLPEAQHKMCRRAEWHDYRAPGLYMLTIVVKDRKPLLGTLKLGHRPWIEWSLLGKVIFKSEVPKITELYPMVEVWLTCIMPDHIHMIVYVRSPMPQGMHLGNVIGAFKGGCTRRWWSLSGIMPTDDQRTDFSLFESNYHDRLLTRYDQLAVWKKYLTDNPRRLAIKRQFPDLFKSWQDYMIDGKPYNIFGNRFLLDNPDKMAVIVHRADSEDVYKAKSEQWLACGERGGVLVSAAVADKEKAVMRLAMDRGYALIQLRDNGFSKYYKPYGEAFDACARGQLLQVSPNDYTPSSATITRAACLGLNALALSLSRGQ